MILAESIRLSFGKREIIRDATLRVAEGEIVGLLGRNGVGKSCLYRILLGELRAEYATITVDGAYCRRPFAVSGLINYLPQQSVHPRDVRISTILSLYGTTLAEVRQHLPDLRIDTANRFGSLSGGEGRLLELYLILLMPTRFTLLDEPFTGLSPLATELATHLITELGARKGILISDHQYRHLLTMTDRNYLLANLYLQPFRTEEELPALGYLPSQPSD